MNISLIAAQLAVASLALLGHPKAQTPDPQATQTPQALFSALIDCVNSGDRQAMKKFLTDNATSDRPVEDRLEHLMDFHDEGAPFKIVEYGPNDTGVVRAVILDAHGTKLQVELAYTTSTPFKMKSLRAQPVGAGPNALGPWSDLASLANIIISRSGAPAIGIAVWHDGSLKTVAKGVRRFGTNDAALPDDPWSIGSIGKPICTTVIGRIIEMGKLRWDETLREALPHTLMRKEYAGVTLEQIMHHRGGIPQDLGFDEAKVTRIVARAITPTQVRENYARDVLSRPAISPAGTKFAYSNAGFALLGHIAETAMGQPYEALVKRFVFRPLGLSHSYTGVDTLPESRPSGHVQGPSGLKPENFTGPMEFMLAPAGGGMYMSVGDLAKFGVEHLKGLHGHDGLLKATTVERLHRGIAESDGPMEYACGWGIESPPGVPQFHGHNGSNGTMRAQLAIFPTENLVVVAIVNSGGESEPAPGLQAAITIAAKYAKVGNR